MFGHRGKPQPKPGAGSGLTRSMLMLLHIFMGGLARPFGGFLFHPRVLDRALNPLAGRPALRFASTAALAAEMVLGRGPAVHPGFLNLRSIVHSARGVFLSVLGIFGPVRPDGAVDFGGGEPVKPRPASSFCLRRAHGVYLP